MSRCLANSKSITIAGIGIIQRGRVRCGETPCDGLTHTGESWTEGHDENGRYMVGRGTGNFLTYTHDFGGADGGDFTMTAQMKLFDLDGSAGTFMSAYRTTF